MEKVPIVCPNCQAKYKVSIQGDVKEKIVFTCRKCAQVIEIDPANLKTGQEPTTELCRAVCKNCNTEFVKNLEDTSDLCYQCRIDLLLKDKKEKEVKPEAAPAAAEAKPSAEPEKSASRYTFRNTDGLVLGPIKIRTVAVLVREKRINGDEEVAKDGEEFHPLREYPELLEFFPDLCPKQESVVAEMQIPLEEKPEPEPAPQEPQVANEAPPSAEPAPSPEAPAPIAQAAPSEVPASAPVDTGAVAVAKIEVAKVPVSEVTVKAEPEPKSYHIRLNGTREFGPVRKSTLLDLIECKFLSGADQVSQDLHSWFALKEVEEFSKLLPPAEEEVVEELVETVDE
jgi:hypothetical protein